MNQFEQPKQGMSTKLIVGIVLGAVAVVGLVMVVMCAGILLPALGKARQAARAIKDSTQIRNCAQALIIQANESSTDLLYQSAEGWEKSILAKNLISPELLTSPFDTPPNISYVYVPTGKNMFNATKVILYLNPNIKAPMYCVAYQDCHVESVTKAELEAIIAKIKPWKPGDEDPK